jgi:glycosyltransferase involved in cell wall biosynthesis
MVGYGFLSTYPPTQCGLATFSSALLRHLTPPNSGDWSGVVRVVDESDTATSRETVAQLVNGRPLSALRAIDVLNDYDVAIVQHEYGVYGGVDGEDVIDVMEHVHVPVIVVLHTVLAAPTPNQRLVLQRVMHAADAVVVLSQAAEHTLLSTYSVDAGHVSVIPHGALPAGRPLPCELGRRAPTILTWGLIGPGKGIEWAIAALGRLRDLDPAPRYLIAGQTHPKVLAREGEAYRDSLRTLAKSTGVAGQVEFDSTYRAVEPLMAMVRQADVVLLPYDSSDQVTSGVLIEAVAALRPVVATRFPHARELLSGGSGLLVPHQDPDAIAVALRRVLTEPGLAARMTQRSANLAPGLQWSAVADRYRALAKMLLSAPARVAS